MLKNFMFYGILILEDNKTIKKGNRMYSILSIIGFISLILACISANKVEKTDVIDESVFEIDNDNN